MCVVDSIGLNEKRKLITLLVMFLMMYRAVLMWDRAITMEHFLIARILSPRRCASFFCQMLKYLCTILSLLCGQNLRYVLNSVNYQGLHGFLAFYYLTLLAQFIVQVCFQVFIDIGTDGAENAGGEVEIEKFNTRVVKVRNQDLVPVFDRFKEYQFGEDPR